MGPILRICGWLPNFAPYSPHVWIADRGCACPSSSPHAQAEHGPAYSPTSAAVKSSLASTPMTATRRLVVYRKSLGLGSVSSKPIRQKPRFGFGRGVGQAHHYSISAITEWPSMRG